MKQPIKAASVRPARPSSAVAIRHSRLDLYRLLLFGLILVYVAIFVRLAFDQHLGMRTHKADLGQIDQAVWNSSRGRFVEMTDNGFVATRLTDHVEPILALISPIFWIWDDVRALLLFQVVVIALGAWPLYELALLRLDQLLSVQERTQIWHLEPLRQLTRPLALTFAVAYLLAPQLQSALLTEFHAAPLAAPLILWAFWAIETRRWQQFVIATLLVASVKEETALLATGLGIWAIWRFTLENLSLNDLRLTKSARYPVLLATIVTLLSLAWFYVATFVIVPAYAQQVYHGAESVYFQRYGALGNSPLDIFKSFLTQPAVIWQIASEPARINYLWTLLAAFGFFSLLAPEILLLGLPVLLANLLSAYPAQYYGEFHYSAPIVPYFAVSALVGMARLWVWLGRRAGQSSTGFQHMPAASAGTMALVAFFRNSRTTLRPLMATLIGVWLLLCAGQVYRVAGRGPLGERYDPTPITLHDRLLARFVAQLPADAAVTATAAVHPHVSHRRYVYQFPIGLEAPGQADWALLDVTTNTDMAPGDLKTRVDQLLTGEWGVIDAADGFLLLHKGASAKMIPAAFYDFARAPAAEKILSQASLESKGVTLDDWPRWRQTKVIAQWVVGKSFDPATNRPELKIITPGGDSLFSYSQTTPPALVWYPPQRWHAGEVIQITSPSLTLPRIWGVVVGDDGADPPGGVVAAYQRLDQGILRPLMLHGDHGWQPSASQIISARLRIVDQQKSTTTLDLQSALSSQRVWPGGQIELWLQWNVTPSWPTDDSVFIHVRRGNVNLVQSDGPPRFFVNNAVSTQSHSIQDLRQLTVPAEMPLGETLTIVIGLYNPQTGQRADVLDANGNVTSNELVIGQLVVGPPPVPDQACALVAQACESQPVR